MNNKGLRCKSENNGNISVSLIYIFLLTFNLNQVNSRLVSGSKIVFFLIVLSKNSKYESALKYSLNFVAC